MPSTLNDDSIPANARVWDFAMPRKSWLMLPLSSENWLTVGAVRFVGSHTRRFSS